MTVPTESNEGGAVDKVQPLNGSANSEVPEESPAKRIKLDEPASTGDAPISRPRMRGVAPVKQEYEIHRNYGIYFGARTNLRLLGI